jgi:hypothetical protein
MLEELGDRQLHYTLRVYAYTPVRHRPTYQQMAQTLNRQFGTQYKANSLRMRLAAHGAKRGHSRGVGS